MSQIRAAGIANNVEFGIEDENALPKMPFQMPISADRLSNMAALGAFEAKLTCFETRKLLETAMTGFNQPRPCGIYDGRGMTLHPVVAVLDTGLSLPQRSKSVQGGINLTNMGDEHAIHDEHGHGTAIAMTILSVLPQARFLSVKLIDDRGVLKDFSLVETAMAWMIDAHQQNPISVICAPFADLSHSTSDEAFQGSRLQQQIATLRALGVPTVAPAGNWYQRFRFDSSYGMAWPAILRDVVSVGAAEWDDGQFQIRLLHSSQRLPLALNTGCATTCITVPGQPGETSGACGLVAGALAALRVRYPDLSVDDLISVLLTRRQTGYDEHGAVYPAVVIDQPFEG